MIYQYWYCTGGTVTSYLCVQAHSLFFGGSVHDNGALKEVISPDSPLNHNKRRQTCMPNPDIAQGQPGRAFKKTGTVIEARTKQARTKLCRFMLTIATLHLGLQADDWQVLEVNLLESEKGCPEQLRHHDIAASKIQETSWSEKPHFSILMPLNHSPQSLVIWPGSQHVVERCCNVQRGPSEGHRYSRCFEIMKEAKVPGLKIGVSIPRENVILGTEEAVFFVGSVVHAGSANKSSSENAAQRLHAYIIPKGHTKPENSTVNLDPYSWAVTSDEQAEQATIEPYQSSKGAMQKKKR